MVAYICNLGVWEVGGGPQECKIRSGLKKTLSQKKERWGDRGRERWGDRGRDERQREDEMGKTDEGGSGDVGPMGNVTLS